MNRSLLTSSFFLLFALIPPGELFARPFSVFADFWDGAYRSGLEKRLFQDDLIEGTPDSIPRWNLDWDGAAHTAYTAGVRSPFKIYGFSTVFSGAYHHKNMEYDFLSVHQEPGVYSKRDFLGSYSADWFFDAMLESKILTDWTGLKIPLWIGPGFHYHARNFNLKDVSYGDRTLLVTTDGAFRSHATSAYLRMAMNHPLKPYSSWLEDFLVVVDVTVPVSSLSEGTFRSNFTRAGLYYNRMYYESNQIRSGYVMKTLQASTGIRYEPFRWILLEAGFRYEESYSRMPGYTNIPLRLANGGVGIQYNPGLQPSLMWQEYFLDRFVYPVERRSDKQGAYFKITYKTETDLF